jgi:gliding motility-associated-like protein
MKALYIFLFLFIGFSLSAQIPCNGEFLTTGTAVEIGDCIQLTSNTTGQQGCTWLNTPVDFSMPFTHTMVMNFGNSDAGADGICLVYQPTGPNQCGMTGGAIGAAGIPSSFIVEFDTWDNGAAQSDIAQDHCAVSIFGDLNNQLNPAVPLGNIEDGADHVVTFSWNPAGTSYTVSFDGVPIISGVYDIINLVFFGATTAYWGYTASTGAAFNTQTVCPSLPPPIVVDAGIDLTTPCFDGLITLDGTGTAFGATYVYDWSSPDGGMIVSGNGTLTPTVMGAGTYILTLTDLNGNCMETDEVVVNLNPIEAVIAPPPFVPCFGNTVFLDGSASSSGPFITYQWTTADGSIVSGANTPTLEINAPGTYTLTVIYNDGSTICTEEATTIALQDPNVPIAQATGGEINCFFPIIQLDGTASSSGNDYQYEWITADGLILSGGNTQTPTVGAAGTYTLIVTNNFNGCFETTDVIVSDNSNPPVAIAVATDSLGCQVSEVILDGTGSSTGSNITYSWTTADGNIVSGEDGLTPIVDVAGSYTLIVSDDNNGCFDSETVIVEGGAAALVADIATPSLLNCIQEELTLDATASQQDPTYTYSWTSSDGNIIAGADGLTPTINAPGIYVLSIASLDGCVGMDSVVVAQNTIPPDAEAGSSQALSCDEPTLELDGTGSSTASVFTYNWTSPDGSIVSGTTTLSPEVNASGTYFIEVTNTINGCTAVDSVLIINDAAAPEVSIDPVDTLNCTTLQLTLDGSNSSQGLGFDFDWSTMDGNFVSGSSSLQATIDAPGTYTLSVTNLNNNCTTLSSITVNQDTVSPIISIASPDTLDCIISAIEIDASASDQGSEFTYNWTANSGNITSGEQSLQPNIDAPGTYSLTITNNNNNCISTSSIDVVQDTISPVAEVILTDTLDCNTPSVLLDGSNSSQGGSFIFNWVVPDPSFIDDTNSLQTDVSGAGSYTLVLLNTQNGCQSSSSVNVVQDTIAPIADAGADVVINCYNPGLSLDGSNSSSGNNIVYQWSGGNIDAGSDSSTPTISQAGTFTLLVENTANGCTATDEVVATDNFAEPTISIATPGLLTCIDSLITLDASNSSQGSIYEYSWTTPDGSILSGADTPQGVVSQAGVYQLQILQTESGCAVTDSVEVMQDVNLPTANILTPAPLNCFDNTIQLDGSNSSQGGNFSFQWSTSNGNISAGGNTLMPTIDAPGTYTLVITDMLNDCEAVAATSVAIDTISPIADAGINQTLNCTNPQLNLDGSASSQGAPYEYLWSTANGNVLSGNTTLNPLIDDSGTYELQVQNTVNGCTETAIVTVGEDFNNPLINIASPELLTCTVNSISLDATASTMIGNPFYSWSTIDGSLQSGMDTASANANTPGTYQLILINQNNGCADTSSVLVSQDTITPIAAIMAADVLTCVDTTQALDASNSSTGINFQYDWSTTDGFINSGTNTLSPTISAPGSYLLSILNTDNGCTATEMITVSQNIVVPELAIDVPDILTCVQTDATLVSNVVNQGNQSYIYNWDTTNGNIINGTSANALIDAPGIYMLSVTDSENGCIGETSIQVQQDTTAPSVLIDLPDTLNCTVTTLQLEAGSSSGGFLFNNDWSSANGVLISGEDSLNPEIGAPGIYTLTITNTTNGCTHTASTNVAQDTTLPTLLIAPADTLSCQQTDILLDGSGSSSGADFTYNWTSADGNILSGEQLPNPSVDEPGTYTLIVTNERNNCVDSLSVEVPEDVDLPTVIIATPDILTCLDTLVNLNGDQSSAGIAFNYNWSTDDGVIVSGSDLSIATTNIPGEYTLIITNTVNGCIDSSTIEVLQDITIPTLEIAPPATLTCGALDITLDASNSSSGSEFSYQWSTMDGNITSGDNSESPIVDAPGNYALQITNTVNGCVDSLSVEVPQNITPPGFVIAPTDTLTCSIQLVELTGVTTSGAPLAFSWTTANGNIVGATDEITANTDSPGLYTLTAQNTENECLDSVQIEVAQDTVAPGISILSPDILTCTVQSLTLDASPSSIGTYSWTTTNGSILSGENTPMPTVDEPGDYTLVLVNPVNGCSSSSDITVAEDVTLPQLSIASPEILTCAVENIWLDASNSSTGSIFEYNWQVGPGGNIITGVDSTIALIDAPGLYTLSILNTVNGCSDQTQVQVNQDIVPPIANAGVDFLLPCFEPTSNLDGSNSSQGVQYTYQWSNANGGLTGGNTTATPLINAPGLYTLLVSNTINGCESSDEVLVTQDFPVANTETVQPLCFGDNGFIAVESVAGGVSPYVYSIDGGEAFQTSASFPGVVPGLYQLIVQDVNGCEYEQDILIEEPDSTVVLATRTEVDILLGEEHQIILQTNIPEDEIASINWQSIPGLSCYDCLDPLATPGQTTDYWVTVTSVDGCSDEAQVRIYVDRSAAIYIPNIFSPNSDGSNDLFYIFARPGSVRNINTFQIYNRWGEAIFQIDDTLPNDPTYGWDGMYRGELMNAAVFTYFAEIEFVDGRVEIFKGDVVLMR